MAKIVDVEGIGAAHGAKLQKAGVASTAALLREGATKAGRTKLAKSTGVSEKLILEWVNHADLMRIKGVGSEYSDLLEAAGVDSVPELSKRVPGNLHAKMAEVNATKKLVRQLPSEKAVAGWVKQAGALEKIVKH
ncbi:MAG: DUF4332 domain-containing protein [Thermoleophilia bacterium]|mgnify:CR=1 FL=1